MLLGIYQKELKTYVHPKTCTQMFTAALFTIDNTGLPVSNPGVFQYVNREIHCGTIHTMEHTSYYKKTQRNLKRLHIVSFHLSDIL